MPAKTPLIVRLPNWVGDVIMTLPSLQALHAAGFDLHLFGQRWIGNLLQGLPATLQPISNSCLNARHQLRATPSNKALLFTNSFSTALIMRLASKEAIGYKNSFRTPLLAKALSKNQTLHEVEYFWNLAQLATKIWLPEAPWPTAIPKKLQLPLGKTAQIQATDKLQAAGIKSPFVILCPSAAGHATGGAPKIWPYWPKLSEALWEQGITQVVCPGPGEDEACQRLTPHAQHLLGTTLSEFACLLKQADYVFANDSGPMHIAAAVGAKVVGIFGATDPKRTHPWGAHYLGHLGQWPTLDEVLTQFNRTMS